MADRPILFSAPMVRALLAGTKTQTRRKLNPQPVQNSAGLWTWSRPGVSVQGGAFELALALRIAEGDRLYVRETIERAGYQGESVGYPADGSWLPNTPWEWVRRSVPSIHMPRRLSRITLTVTDVRVQRLQDISEADAIAEGIEDVTREVASSDPSLRFWKRYRDGGWNGYVDTAEGSYASLWTEINGPGSWDKNPWVAAYSFTVALGNIDEIGVA